MEVIEGNEVEGELSLSSAMGDWGRTGNITVIIIRTVTWGWNHPKATRLLCSMVKNNSSRIQRILCAKVIENLRYHSVH